MKRRKQKRTKLHKAKSSRVRPALWGGVVVISLYMVWRIFFAFSGIYQTEAAQHVTVNDSFETTAWFFRDETTVSGSSSDTVQHLVSSGERVQQDAPLAVIYPDEQSLEISRSVESLDKEVTMLETALQTAGDESDAAKLDQSIVSSLRQLAEELKSGSGSSLDTTAEAIRTQSLRRIASTLDVIALEAERDSLAAQRDNLNRQLSGNSTQISAPSSGYFSEIVDGYENIFTLDALDGLVPGRLATLASQKEMTTSSSFLGKIITGFHWYLAAEVSAEDAERLTVGADIRVGFTKASLETPVSVYRINHDEGADTAVIILEGADFNTELVSMRNQPVEVIIGTYTGLLVPKEAIRMENEETVVYILSGSVTKRKRIDKLYESDKFYIVTQSATDENALVEQDMIIIRGKGLQNNMVVNVSSRIPKG